MELSLNRRSVNCFKKLSDASAIVEAYSECVVPDTQGDIIQILTASFITKIRSKDLEADEICIKAEINASVIYSSDNGIEKLDAVLPFNAKLPAKEPDSGCVICADLQTEKWDIRMLNPRKIALNVNVSAKAECYKNTEYVWYERPEELPEKLYVKSENAALRLIDTVTEKTISLNEEFELMYGENIKPLSAKASYQPESIETVGAKLVLRGNAEIETIYLADGEMKSEKFSTPFSQLFDVNGENGSEYEAVILSTGEYYDISDGKLTSELHAVIQLIYYRGCEIIYASDAYSSEYETSLKSEAVSFCAEAEAVTQKDSFQMLYEPSSDAAEVLLTRAYVLGIETAADKTSVGIFAEVIYRDTDNELLCGRVRGKTEFTLDNCSEYKNITARICGTRAFNSENGIEIRGEVRLSAKREIPIEIYSLAAIEEGEKLPEIAASAYIVFSDGDLWSVAKKYRSCPEMIKEIGDSENKRRSVKRLFVPVIK